MKTLNIVDNSIIFCAKEARAPIEWVEFVLQNCEKLHFVRGLLAY